MEDGKIVDPRILERVQKLLAMAADTSSPNEAAIAARRAEALMRKHQLDQVDVMVKNLDGDSVEISTVDHVSTIYGANYKATGMPGWISVIAVAAAVMNECEVDRQGGLTRFYGVAGDAQVAAEIFRFLIQETSRLAKKFQGSRGSKNSFRMGCAGELQHRCKEIADERKRQFEETSSGKELVILKKALIEQNAGREFNYSSRGSNVRDGHAYNAGREAGSRVNLNAQVGGKQQEKLRG